MFHRQDAATAATSAHRTAEPEDGVQLWDFTPPLQPAWSWRGACGPCTAARVLAQRAGGKGSPGAGCVCRPCNWHLNYNRAEGHRPALLHCCTGDEKRSQLRIMHALNGADNPVILPFIRELPEPGADPALSACRQPTGEQSSHAACPPAPVVRDAETRHQPTPILIIKSLAASYGPMLRQRAASTVKRAVRKLDGIEVAAERLIEVVQDASENRLEHQAHQLCITSFTIQKAFSRFCQALVRRVCHISPWRLSGSQRRMPSAARPRMWR